MIESRHDIDLRQSLKSLSLNDLEYFLPGA